jgi:hypothetical protein
VAADRALGTAVLASSSTGPSPGSPHPVASMPSPSPALERVPWSFEGRLAVAALFRALGDPGRLSLVGFIAEAERWGTQCATHVGLAQGRTSAHLARLVSSGLVSR